MAQTRPILSIADIDECAKNGSPCDENADCFNNDGSFSCVCKNGFTGNGTVCLGKIFFSGLIVICWLVYDNDDEEVDVMILLQISTSVKSGICVMMTLTALTPTDLIRAFASKDSLEVARTVQVGITPFLSKGASKGVLRFSW